MKRGRLAAAALAVALAAVSLVGCTAGSSGNGADPQLRGTWHLVAGSDAHGSLQLEGNDITLTIGQQSSGLSLCRKYTASVTGQVGVVYIRVDEPGGGADCPNAIVAALDKRYITALEATAYARVSSGFLVLTSRTTSLTFSSKPPAANAQLTRTSWMLAQLPKSAQATPVQDAGAGRFVLTFTGSNSLRLDSPCSRLDENYAAAQGYLRPVSSTVNIRYGKSCSEADQARDQDMRSLVLGAFITEFTYAAGDRQTSLEVTSLVTGVTGLFKSIPLR